MKKIKILIIASLSLIIIPKVALAATVNITDDSLEASLNKIVKTSNESKKDDEDYSPVTFSIDKTAHKITLTYESYKSVFDYNISDDNVSFSEIVKYYKGMSYEEYKNNSDSTFSYTALMYGALADHYEINYEDLLVYYGLTYLNAALKSAENNAGEITSSCPAVIDDDEFTAITGGNIVKASEFGNYAITCIKESMDTLSGKEVKDIDNDGINSFTLSMTDDVNEMPNVINNENEYNIKYVLTVNRNADFSQINGLAAKIGESITGKIENKDDESKEDNTNVSKDEEPTTSKVENTNPKTGYSYHLISLILIFIIILISYLKIAKKDLFKRI